MLEVCEGVGVNFCDTSEMSGFLWVKFEMSTILKYFQQIYRKMACCIQHFYTYLLSTHCKHSKSQLHRS